MRSRAHAASGDTPALLAPAMGPSLQAAVQVQLRAVSAAALLAVLLAAAAPASTRAAQGARRSLLQPDLPQLPPTLAQQPPRLPPVAVASPPPPTTNPPPRPSLSLAALANALTPAGAPPAVHTNPGVSSPSPSNDARPTAAGARPQQPAPAQGDAAAPAAAAKPTASHEAAKVMLHMGVNTLAAVSPRVGLGARFICWLAVLANGTCLALQWLTDALLMAERVPYLHHALFYSTCILLLSQ